jgi:undecaprenyl phosphate-alpha-L-ara4FN deformylase
MTISDRLSVDGVGLVPIRVGLRVDVDTFSGTRQGLPVLLKAFDDAGIKASFFFTLGPDNMGRHVWRLLKPAFLWKMLRSNAPGLYGWDILLRGTIGSGPRIAERLKDTIASVENAGHEVGLHAWDHHLWQSRADDMSPEEIHEQLQLAQDAFVSVFGHASTSSACAGWKCNERVLIEKEKFDFRYNSDCRGQSLFRPLIAGQPGTPQIPVTLPTYDEVIGSNGITDSNYNDYLLSLLKPDGLNVYTIHTEVEGMSRSGLFREMLYKASQRGIRFVPLMELLVENTLIPSGHVKPGALSGREGMVCWQSAADMPG